MSLRAAPGKILVRAPNWVGDVVMMSPALRALRRGFPDAEITVEARPFLRDLIEGLGSVDAFLPDPSRDLSRSGVRNLTEGYRRLVARVKRLRAGRFECAVLLPDSYSAAFGPFFARIPYRISYARGPLQPLMMSETLEPPRENGKRVPFSMIERYLRLTRALGCEDDGLETEVPIDDRARDRVEARLRALGVGEDERLLVVVPGAKYGSSKLWPGRHYASACDEILDEHGLRVVLAPGPGEEPNATEIAELMEGPSLSLADPTTTLAELVALVDRASLVVTNDTGPRHIAVALGIPTVAMLGPTDARHTDHLLERQRVLREEVDCSPCGLRTCPIDHRCMTRLQPMRVVAAAAELLA